MADGFHADFLADERQLLTNAKRALFLAVQVLSPSTPPPPSPPSLATYTRVNLQKDIAEI